MVAASMSARLPFWSEFFTFRGRTNRGRYWLTALVVGLITLPFFIAVALAIGMERVSRGEGTLPLSLVSVMVSIPILLAGIRRLHDRDKSGHWLWLFYGGSFVLNFIGQVLQLGGSPMGGGLLMLASFAISIWGFVELGCLRGTSGPNRFGQDPLQGLSA